MESITQSNSYKKELWDLIVGTVQTKSKTLGV